jgi:chromosome partitioning protein
MSQAAIIEKRPRRGGRRTRDGAISTTLATKYLLLASAKGGVGKTTCARNIATAATLAGRRVAMIDLDQQRSLSKWWERRPDEAPQIDCFSANIDQIQDVLAAVGEYSLVVIDTPPAVEFFPEQIKALILRSDFILVPTGTTRDDTDSTIEFMEVVQGLAKPAAYVLCKVNRRARSLLDAKHRLAESGGRICPFEVPTYEDFAAAADIGVGIMEIKGAKGADDVSGVWTFVRKEIGL